MYVNLHFKKIAALTVGLLLAAAVDAQTITKVFRRVPLKTVLEEVEAQTGYSFIFENKELDADRPVTAAFDKATVRTVLDQVLDPSLRYSVNGKLVTISKRAVADTPPAGKDRTVR